MTLKIKTTKKEELKNKDDPKNTDFVGQITPPRMHPQNFFCQTSDLGLRLEVDFVFPLSQEQQQEQEEPLTKIYRIEWN